MNNYDIAKDVFNVLQPDEVCLRKFSSSVKSAARNKVKPHRCYICNSVIEGTCNSHSIPRFVLKNLGANGQMYTHNKIIDIPFIDSVKGINNAGTFRLICKNCDSKIFRDYEEPDMWKSKPNKKMLTQIAIKNWLYIIYRKLIETEELHELRDNTYNKLSRCTGDNIGQGIECPIANFQYNYIDGSSKYYDNLAKLDLDEYNRRLNKDKEALMSSTGSNSEYRIVLYHRLNYVVPYAHQGCIALQSDLYGNCINNVYNANHKYKTMPLHICIFPLKSSSIILVFKGKTDHRYNQFISQFNGLRVIDKLGVLNYIILLYSDALFISKNIDSSILSDPNLRQASNQLDNAGLYSGEKEIKAALNEYRLDKWRKVPNLLSKEYAILHD